LVCDIIFVFVYFSELLVKLVYLSVTQLMPSLVNIYQQCKYIFYIMCEQGKWVFGLYIHVPEPTSVKCTYRTIQYKDFNQESCDLAYSSTYGHKTSERRVYTRTNKNCQSEHYKINILFWLDNLGVRVEISCLMFFMTIRSGLYKKCAWH
jgi:hypothetical protein